MINEDPKALPTILFMACLVFNLLALFAVDVDTRYVFPLSGLAAALGGVAALLTAPGRIVRGLFACGLAVIGALLPIFVYVQNMDSLFARFLADAAVPGLTFLGLASACVLAGGMKAKNFAVAFVFAVMAVLVTPIILMFVYPALNVGLQAGPVVYVIVQAIVNVLIFAGFVYVVKNIEVQPASGFSDLGGTSADFGI